MNRHFPNCAILVIIGIIIHLAKKSLRITSWTRNNIPFNSQKSVEAPHDVSPPALCGAHIDKSLRAIESYSCAFRECVQLWVLIFSCRGENRHTLLVFNPTVTSLNPLSCLLLSSWPTSANIWDVGHNQRGQHTTSTNSLWAFSHFAPGIKLLMLLYQPFCSQRVSRILPNALGSWLFSGVWCYCLLSGQHM